LLKCCSQTSKGKHIEFYVAYTLTSLNPMPNAQVCVYLTVHITQLQLQINIFKTSLYHIPHVFIRILAAENLDVCTACDP
jgi:hypothetical protein